jgi:hypothetical protein
MSTLENRPNTALLVIDVQKGVVKEAHDRDTALRTSAALSRRRGANGSPSSGSSTPTGGL